MPAGARVKMLKMHIPPSGLTAGHWVEKILELLVLVEKIFKLLVFRWRQSKKFLVLGERRKPLTNSIHPI